MAEHGQEPRSTGESKDRNYSLWPVRRNRWEKDSRIGPVYLWPPLSSGKSDKCSLPLRSWLKRKVFFLIYWWWIWNEMNSYPAWLFEEASHTKFKNEKLQKKKSSCVGIAPLVGQEETSLHFCSSFLKSLDMDSMSPLNGMRATSRHKCVHGTVSAISNCTKVIWQVHLPCCAQ